MSNNNFISENIIEIRYKPYPEMLDYRGGLVSAIAQQMSLPHWKIDQNRVDVFDKDETLRVFASFANAGITYRNTDGNEFGHKASDYLRFVLKKRPYQDRIFVTRIGCKSRIGYPSSLSFNNLFQRYSSAIHISDEYKRIMDAEIIDVGFPINFRTNIGNLNSVGGPMEKEQLKKFFDFMKDDDLPDSALYIEFDYWSKPEREMSASQITNLALDYSNENWKKAEMLRDLILAEQENG